MIDLETGRTIAACIALSSMLVMLGGILFLAWDAYRMTRE